MNDLIKITVLAFIVFCIWDDMKSNNLSAEEWVKIKVQNSMEEIQSYGDNSVENLQKLGNEIYKNEDGIKFKVEDVVIRALGDVDEGDLDYAQEIIEEFYGYRCYKDNPLKIDEPIYINGSDDIIDAEACIDYLRNEEKTVYIIDKRLWTKGDFLRGYAANGNTIIVRGDKSFMRETLIHEVGHTLGLGHCEDLSCIMAINNDEYDSGTFCKKCRRKLN